MTSTVIIGGSNGIGFVLAQRAAKNGHDVVITSRDKERADAIAADIGGSTRGLAIDLSVPESIADALADITEVDNLVITAIEQGPNTLRALDIPFAVRSVTTKLVSYAEVVRVLLDPHTSKVHSTEDASVVLFGGLAKERPYPGSTIVTTFNGGITGLVRTLAVEIAPRRVNAIHPGLVGDSPKWRDVPDHPAAARTPIGRLITMDEVADATEFLLRNKGMNAQDLIIDGGWLVS